MSKTRNQALEPVFPWRDLQRLWRWKSVSASRSPRAIGSSCGPATDGWTRWHDGAHDPWPWLAYFTGVIADAYAVFAERAAAAKSPGTKQQRIRDHILRHAPGRFRLADIRSAVPGVSDQTIRIVLDQLKQEGQIQSDGTGRAATWSRR